MSEEPESEVLPLGQVVLDVEAWIAESEEWKELYDQWAGEFYGVLEHVLGDDVEERLEEADEVVSFYIDTACLEFFLAFREEEFESPLAAFLQDQGDALTDEQKEFLTGLQNSNFSLYDVVDAAPGEYIVLKDLVMEGEPIRIDDDGTGTDFEVGETVAGRIIEVSGKPTLTAIAFGLGDESRKEILEYFEESVKDLLKDEVKLLRKDPRTIRRARSKAQQFLPPISTAHWVGDRFDEMEDSGAFDNLQIISVRYSEGPTEAQTHARLDDDPRFEKNAELEGGWVLMVEDSPAAMVRWSDGLTAIVRSRDTVDTLDAALRARFGPILGAPEVSEMSIAEAMAQVEAASQEAPGEA